VAFPEIRAAIASMNDEPFTTEQLRSLEEFLPTHDESAALEAYRSANSSSSTGGLELLGQAERYMVEMLRFPTAARRIQCMVYKQQFKGRIQECKVFTCIVCSHVD
jgi:hypothetical protein